MRARHTILNWPTIPLAAAFFLLGWIDRSHADTNAPAAAIPNSPITEIVFGGDAHFPPYEFLDDHGQPAGLDVDLIRAVARSQGIKVRVELRPWTEIRTGLPAGKFDVAAMYRSTQRAREVDFAIPHELIYHEMFVRQGASPVNAVADLAGKGVLVEKDAFADDALTEMGFDLRRVESEPEALRRLAAGDGDVAVVTQTPGRPFLDREALSDKVVATGPPVLLAEYAFVTSKGRRDLIEILNQGVAAVKASGEFGRIYNTWIHPDRSARLAREIGWALAAALTVVVAGALWNYSLRQRVAEQTKALRREFQEKERAQATLAQTERSLRQSQKMEVVGRLAGGIAHDFNNILTVILNYASFLREELLAQKKATADVDEILSATERAMRLTKQLLGFSRATPLKIEPLDLVAVGQEMRALIQRLVGEHITVKTAFAREPVVVEADLVLIEQMVLNLAANARDAMQDGGKLTFTIEPRTLPAGNAVSLPAGDYAAIVMTDDGRGMDQETMERIFDPFFTTKNPGQGTGLGLATVLANVTKLDGKVLVASTPGSGATFTLLLPRSRGAVPVAAHAGGFDKVPRPGNAQTVLVVEDDDALRHAACMALERAGFQILEARDGMEAMDVAGQNKAISIVVTDVVMPRRSGPQLVAELRPRIPGLYVLFVSGYVQEDEKIDLTQPRTAFLQKPYGPQSLVKSILALTATA